MIEYFNNVPHAVYTTLSNFDFEMNYHGWMMNYESGGGKNDHFDIGNFVTPELWKVWIRPDFGGTIKVKQPEVQLLKKPLRLKTPYTHHPKSSINPFLVSEEVSDIVYCARCEGYYTDMCMHHQYWCDKDHVIKYTDNDETAE